MPDLNFQLYVLSDGRAGLYRTLLSVWKLELLPTNLTILTNPDKSEVIRRSINTVTEDTNQIGPPTQIMENNLGWKNQILEDCSNRSFDASGFLAERDMLLPEYSQITSGTKTIDQITYLSYQQRKRFGNSRKKSGKLGAKNPISSVVLAHSQISNFLNDTVFLENYQFIIPSNQQYKLDDSKPKLLIQSNIKSPFDL